MSLKYFVNGVEQTDTSVRIKGAPEILTEAADGSFATFAVEIKDPQGTLDYIQLQTFAVEESTATPARIVTGRIFNIKVNRGPFLTGKKRIYNFEVADLNGLLHWQLLQGADAKRPRELIDDRIAWLLANPAVDGLVFDHGLIASRPGQMIDEADYRGKYPDEVIADTAYGFIFFVTWDAVAGEPSLFYDLPTASTFDATVGLTNVPSEEDATHLACHPDPDYESAGEDIYCRVLLKYVGGEILRHRQATHDEFFAGETNHRDGLYQSDRIGKLTTAENAAAQYLVDHSGANVTATVRVKVPAADVNKLRAGMRITSAHLEHFPGFDPAIAVRISQRSISLSGTGDQQTNAYYDLTLALRTHGITTPDHGDPGGFPHQPPSGGHWWEGGMTVDGDSFAYAGTARDGFQPDSDYAFFIEVVETSGPIITYATNVCPEFASPTHGGLNGPDLDIDTAEFANVSGKMDLQTPGPGGDTTIWSGVIHTSAGVDPLDVFDMRATTADGDHSGDHSTSVSFWFDPVGDPEFEPQPPLPGQWVMETLNPPDGTQTAFTASWPYADGSLTVWVDNLDQSMAMTESDPETGEFTLAFAPTTSERVRVRYQGR